MGTMGTPVLLDRASSPWKIAAAYVLFSLIWIFFSDSLVGRLARTPQQVEWMQSVKGTAWVVFSGVVLYLFVFRHIQKVRQLESQARSSLVEGERIGAFGTLTRDEKGAIAWSDGVSRLFGLELGARAGLDTLLSRVHPDDRERVAAELNRPFTVQDLAPYEFRVLRGGDERRVRCLRRLESEAGHRTMLTVFQDVTELRGMERAAGETLSILRGSLEATADAIVVVAADRTILAWNDRFLRMWNLRGDEMPVSDVAFVERVIPVVRNPERFSQWIDEIYRRTEIACFDLVELVDGRVFERFTGPVPLADGPPARIWSYREVTERIRAEEELRRRDEHLSESQRLAQLGSFEIDASRESVTVSEGLLAIYGLPEETRELPVELFRRFRHPDDAELVDRQLAEIRQGRGSREAEFRIARKDGSIRWVAARARLVRRGDGSDVVFGVMQDITERRQIAGALEELEQQKEALSRNVTLLLRSTLAGLVTVDLSGRTLLVNEAASQMLHYGKDELVGQPLHERVHRDSAGDPCPLRDANVGSLPVQLFNQQLIRKDGSVLPCDMLISPILEGEVRVGSSLAFIDISERKNLESQLERADRLAGLGRLAANIAHEINNVLMGILPFAELMARQTDGAVVRAGEQIRGSVQRGRRITHEILRFGRPVEPSLAPVAVRPWLESLGEELAGIVGTRGQWTLSLPERDLWIRADAEQLGQVFTNLAVNAVSALPEEGGEVELSVGEERAGETLPFGTVPSTASRWVRMSLHDEGEGIGPDVLPQIFEPFYTTRREGTGLGLPIAQKLVAAHGGVVFVESAGGKGTSFHVLLPAIDAPVVPAGPRPSDPAFPDARSGRGGTILLVEDDPDVAAGLVAGLELEGFQVPVARTGAEAISMARELRPRAVILDVGLPDMEGDVVCERLLAANPSLPVIFSTGHGDAARLAHWLERDNVRLLMKPYSFDELLPLLHERLRHG